MLAEYVMYSRLSLYFFLKLPSLDSYVFYFPLVADFDVRGCINRYVRHLSVFSPRGVTPMSKFVCVLPFPDGDARRHKDLS